MNSIAVTRVARLGMIIVIAVLCATAVAVLMSAERVMRAELQSVNTSTLTIYGAVHAEGGLDNLTEAVRAATQSPLGVREIAGLFDPNGNPLAGDLTSEPPVDQIESIRLVHAPGEPETVYVSKRIFFPDAVLYVGRPTRIIDSTITNLAWIMPLAGIAILATLIASGGYAATVLGRLLTRIETTLEAFSAGDATARVPLGPDQNDRFHNVSLGINRNLDALDRTATTLQNTTIAIAHDLRTPLTRASLALQNVQGRPDVTDAVSDAIEVANGELNRLRQTFDTILRISNIGALRSDAAFGTFDLAALVNDIADGYAPVLEDAGYTLEVTQQPAAIVRGDRNMIGQLIVNLLTNITRHCPPGTVARISVEQAGNTTALNVSDNGPGVPDDALRTIFDPFSRLDPSRSKDGTGLGLALVLAIAKHHDADIEATDLFPGLGITLRLKTASSPSAV